MQKRIFHTFFDFVCNRPGIFWHILQRKKNTNTKILLNPQKTERSEYFLTPQIVIYEETLLAHLCLPLHCPLSTVLCNTALVEGERGQLSKLGSSYLLQSQSISAQWWWMQYCCCYIIMQWSLPLLFSLVQDSPPDGLSHTLWRTGGGERGGDPKKQENSVWLKKRRGSVYLIDKVLSAVSEYCNSVELYIVVVCRWCHLSEITVHITIILFCALYPLAQYCISKANIERLKSSFLRNHFWALKIPGPVFLCKEKVIKLDTNKAESQYMGGQDLNFKIVGHLFWAAEKSNFIWSCFLLFL